MAIREMIAADLATRAGTTPGYLSNLLSGKRVSPSWEMICKLALALQVNPHWLKGEEAAEMSADQDTVNSTIEIVVREGSASFGNQSGWEKLFSGLIETMTNAQLMSLVRQEITRAKVQDQPPADWVQHLLAKIEERNL